MLRPYHDDDSAPLERLARYAGDVEYLMLLDETRVKRAVEEGSKDPPIAGRHITHDPTITMYRCVVVFFFVHVPWEKTISKK